MSRNFIIAASAIVGLAAASPASAGDPRGTWVTDDGKARIAIADCSGALCGKIVALTEPNDPATGKPKTDGKNADASKRSRPMIGVPIVIDMKPASADKWSGQVYNAEDGKTYDGSITLVDAKTLTLQGCTLGGFVCKSRTWTRAN
jgi:uncharacterized protein (DUF2147 family)